MSEHYDLIVIGSGPAGESAAELAAAFGHRALIIEKSRPGGTVTTSGGVPTKTLREAALYFSGFRDRDIYGIKLDTPPELALEKIRHRTWGVCETLQKVTYENISQRGIDYLQGTARLNSDKSVTVTLPDGNEKALIAERAVLIATGSSPARPAAFELNHPGICDTDTILSRGKPPKDLLIIGGGAVGVEFASIARALDIPVSIVNRDHRLVGMMDEEMSARLAEVFTHLGVQIFSDCTAKSVEIHPNGEMLTVHLSNGQRKTVDTILFAAGRIPNTDGLGLANAGVKLDSRGRIIVDSQFCTSVPGVYAAGDVLHSTLASIAMEQGRIMVCHAFGIPYEGTLDPTPVSAVYGIPEIASAGLTEQQCKEMQLDYEIGRSELDVTPRGAIAGRGGLLKIIFHKSDRKLLGVHCLGDIASELVGIGQMGIRCGATINTIMNMSMNTPTYSYAYKYAAFDGLRRLTGRNQPGRTV